MSLWRRETTALLGAVRFFTRIPVPDSVGHSAAGLNDSARYFSAVGLLVGGLGAAVFWAAQWGWSLPVAVLLSMAATVFLTGAFHEDGLADSTDGLGGGWTPEAMLRIMKDSRIGTFGTIALMLALALKFAALVSLPAAWIAPALIAGHALSRTCSTLLIARLDYVREDALAKSKPLATRLGPGSVVVSILFALGGLWFCKNFVPLPPLLLGVVLAGVSTLWFARKMRQLLGGYTGDLLGGTQQIAEIAFYLGLAWHWA